MNSKDLGSRGRTRSGRTLGAGYGFSELDSHPYLAKWLDIEVVSLRLMDDGSITGYLSCGGYLLYYPQAFDSYSTA